MADSTLNQITRTDNIADDDLLLMWKDGINATRAIKVGDFNSGLMSRIETVEDLIPSDTSTDNKLVNEGNISQKLNFTINAHNIRSIIFPSGYTGDVIVRLYIINATETVEVHIVGYNEINGKYNGWYKSTGSNLYVDISTNYQIDICNNSETAVDVLAEIYAGEKALVSLGSSGTFTYWGDNLLSLQTENLQTPLTIAGSQRTTVEQALEALVPVDEVADDDMHAVTSNTVYDTIIKALEPTSIIIQNLSLCVGHITGASQSIAFYIPYTFIKRIPSEITVNSFSITVRCCEGGYIDDSLSNKITQNTIGVSITEITARKNGIYINLYKNTTWKVGTSSTVVTNNTPVSVDCDINLTFSYS